MLDLLKHYGSWRLHTRAAGAEVGQDWAWQVLAAVSMWHVPMAGGTWLGAVTHVYGTLYQLCTQQHGWSACMVITKFTLSSEPRLGSLEWASLQENSGCEALLAGKVASVCAAPDAFRWLCVHAGGQGRKQRLSVPSFLKFSNTLQNQYEMLCKLTFLCCPFMQVAISLRVVTKV